MSGLDGLATEIKQGRSDISLKSLRWPERNQGRKSRRFRIVEDGLAYGSQSEVNFARALKRRGLPFIPNPVICLGPDASPEVDFVIFYQGMVIIVEIHGKPFHPAGRTVNDWNRTRPLLERGVLVDFVDSDDLRTEADADEAVRRTLKLCVGQAA